MFDGRESIRTCVLVSVFVCFGLSSQYPEDTESIWAARAENYSVFYKGFNKDKCNCMKGGETRLSRRV